MNRDFEIEKLNKLFESRVRLGVMSVLCVNEKMDFNTLKSLLKVTDGNLASHISALEKAGCIEVEKSFVGRKPKTVYLLTAQGRMAFKSHLKSLELLIQKTST